MLPERLFSLQSTKTQSYIPSIGGITEVDQAIASGLCSGMSEKWYKAARLKFCLDASVINWLEIQLWQEVCGIATKEKWKIPKGKERLRNMCKLAIIETQKPELFIKTNAWNTRASFLEIKKSAWFSTWAGRYEVIYELLNNWSNSAYRFVKHKQIDNTD